MNGLVGGALFLGGLGPGPSLNPALERQCYYELHVGTRKSAKMLMDVLTYCTATFAFNTD